MIGKYLGTAFLLLGINFYVLSQSTIFISAQTKGKLQDGYGVTITIQEVSSKKTYKSKSLGILSSHSYIENIPPGNYVVTKIEIPLGSVIYINESKEMRTFFDTLKIHSNSNNYLGNFYGVRQVGDSAVFRLAIKSDNIPSKLIKKACKKRLVNPNQEWIKHYPYKEEDFLLF